MTARSGPGEPELGRVVRHEDGGVLLPGAGEWTAAAGPYRLAWRRLRRDPTVLVAAGVFLVIVLASLLAPVYAGQIAHTGPDVNHLSEVIDIGGHPRDVVSLTGIPIGPTWHARFFLGADPNGRDLAVRLLYGGRTSLAISALATLVTMVVATLVGVTAGYFRGWADTLLSRMLDLVWAYPALLLGIALGVNLELGGISIGPLHISGGSDLVPALVIGVVYVPYVARPLRGEVLSLREREFVEAARLLGASRLRVMFGEILPNLTSTLAVFIALQLAQSMVLEASLSFLGAGVQAPDPSWGTMLAGSVQLVTTSPQLTLAPGLTLVAAVLSVNLVGNGLRRALDPRARVRIR